MKRRREYYDPGASPAPRNYQRALRRDRVRQIARQTRSARDVQRLQRAAEKRARKAARRVPETSRDE